MYNHDSRTIQPGDTYLCLPGGEAYCDTALSNGAKDIIHCSRSEMADIVNKAYDYPSQKLNVVGVTGTNGKSSVCSFVFQALQMCGRKPYIQGTLNARLTTPESVETIQAMKQHYDNGGTDFIMEVSSHGIHQQRVAGIDFNITCLTNISQDHLDYHGTFEEYVRIKRSFLSDFPGKSIDAKDFEIVEDIKHLHLLGVFNQLNLKAAFAILVACSIDEESAKDALSKVKSPAGRFERVESLAPFSVIVDYAHTPDGLDNVLTEVRCIANQNNAKVITCFGCGGDRDKDKRPKMANVVENYSDYIIVTNDNPRTEDANTIISDIQTGFKQDNRIVYIQPERDLAIQKAVSIANPGDVVMITGKGHEDYQIIGDTKYPFDDKKEVIKALKSLGFL